MNQNLEFFDHVPTVWDDTKVMDGEISKYVTIARRKGEEWFVGTVTNTDARDLKLSLKFLAPGKKYEASIYYDDPNSKLEQRFQSSV
jgi:alpha-glucosidase